MDPSADTGRVSATGDPLGSGSAIVSASAPGSGSESGSGPEVFDPTRPHPARIYDYWLGGKDSFAADRRLAERIAQLAPWVISDARGNRAFLGRAVRYLARAGIRQIVDIGSGLPSSGNVHEVAQAVDAGCRVVYVDRDPNKSGCVHAQSHEPRLLRFGV